MKTLSIRKMLALGLGCALPLFAVQADEATDLTEGAKVLTSENGLTFKEAKDSPYTALLSKDGLKVDLPAGSQTFVIDFGKLTELAGLSFTNQSAKGTVTFKGAGNLHSADSANWMELSLPQVFDATLGAEHVSFSFAPAEVRYVMVTMNVEQGGEIADLGAMGLGDFETIQAFEGNEQEFEDLVPTQNEGGRIPTPQEVSP